MARKKHYPTRHYYAEWRPYGTNTLSWGMELYRFDSREERDEWVERMNEYGDRERWAAVTTREITHRYDIGKFENDPFSDYCHEHDGVTRTCAGRIPLYVTTRPSYRP